MLLGGIALLCLCSACFVAGRRDEILRSAATVPRLSRLAKQVSAISWIHENGVSAESHYDQALTHPGTSSPAPSHEAGKDRADTLAQVAKPDDKQKVEALVEP